MLATCNYLHTYKKLYLRSIKSTMWMCFSKIIAIAGIKIVTGIAPKGWIKTYTTAATISKKYIKDEKYGEGTTIRGKYKITGTLLCRKY